MWETLTRNAEKGILDYFKEMGYNDKGNKRRGYVNLYEQKGYERWEDPTAEDIGHLKTHTAESAILDFKQARICEQFAHRLKMKAQGTGKLHIKLWIS